MSEIRNLLNETRMFPPPEKFQSRASIQSLDDYHKIWTSAASNPDRFWSDQAKSLLEWDQKWTDVLDWQPPNAKWFVNGKLNVSYNCVDRHAHKDKNAIIWEGEKGEVRNISYKELAKKVKRCAAGLKSLGVQAGDIVTIYMPLVPETLITMLACARIGAPHSVVFAGFSAQALADRIIDAKSKLVVTANGGYRKGKLLNFLNNVTEAAQKAPCLQRVLVYDRTGEQGSFDSELCVRWQDYCEGRVPQEDMQSFDSEHPLFLLYTSGSTGKPKGILHSSAGYLLGATLSSRFIFDLKSEDVFWCTADPGWITGHSYVTYGPLSNGATILIYEGAPNYPDSGRFWNLIEKHKVSIFYTAPTAIRAFMQAGDQWPEKYDLSSLRLLGTVGEPINPKAWEWFYEKIGKGQCPIVDTWWQTETGGIMISPLPGATPTVPGSATLPFFGVVPEVVNEDGEPTAVNQGGYLTITKPWPSMLRGIHGDEKRFFETYWKKFPGKYFTGDAARRDEKGYYWIMGRLDDVINVSGHRLSTMEIESALVSHPAVAEAATIGAKDDITGEAVVCYVCLKSDADRPTKLEQDLCDHIVNQIGKVARPRSVQIVDALPKTRSGKIMRRLLRDLASNNSLGDTSTLEDRASIDSFRGSNQSP